MLNAVKHLIADITVGDAQFANRSFAMLGMTRGILFIPFVQHLSCNLARTVADLSRGILKQVQDPTEANAQFELNNRAGNHQFTKSIIH